MNRRSILKAIGVVAVAPAFSLARSKRTPQTLFPPRLKPGDTVGLINPAGAIYNPDDLLVVEETLQALDLVPKRGAHLLDRRGYLGGSDENRAADVNVMFKDSGIDAILAVRGGWGCNRILPLLEYEAIGKNPKILMGYSDITSLLVALYARCGLVSFHGPVGISTWNEFTVDYVRRILFDGEAVQMDQPVDLNNLGVQTDDRIHMINPGVAQGVLVGGNLSVLTAMVGSEYLPDWKNKILFVEEVGEDIYRIDRMLTQLKLAGILDKLSGFVFGKCTNCDVGESYGSLTFNEVIDDHIKPLGIPSWHGSMIGHISDKFTVPVGSRAEINAATGSIRLLEPAVK